MSDGDVGFEGTNHTSATRHQQSILFLIYSYRLRSLI